MRSTGIATIGMVSWGTHFCQFYSTTADLLEVLVPYFKAGLEADEFCLWITASPLSVRDAWRAMEKAVPEIESYRTRGRIEIVPHTEWYLAGGRFDGARVVHAWCEKLEAALARGCSGMRLTGDMAWLDQKDWPAFAHYEAAVDEMVARSRIVALCTYLADRCGAAEITEIVRSHRFALIKRDGRWALVEGADRRRIHESEQALLDTEERYRLLVEGVQDHAIYCIEPDGTVGSWNRGAERLKGYSAAEAIGRPFGMFYPASAPYTGKPRSLLEAAARCGRAQDEGWHVRKDGSLFWADVVITALRDSQGRLTGYANVTRDITVRKLAHDALRESEQKLQKQAAELEAVFAAQTDSILVFGPEGVVVRVNAAAKELLGLDPTGLHLTDPALGLGTDSATQFSGTARALAGETIRAASLEHQTPTTGQQRTLMVSSAPMRDAQGAIVGAVTVLRDITEQKRAEDALRENEARVRAQADELQTIINAVPAAIWVAHDPDCLRITGNRTSYELLGLVPGKNASKSAPPDERPAGFVLEQDGRSMTPDEMPIQRAARGETIHGCHFELVLQNGTRVHLHGNAVPLRDQQGIPCGSVGAFLDITERKRAEEALRRSEACLGLLSRIAGRLLAAEDPQAEVDELCGEVMAHLDCQVFFNFLVASRAEEPLTLNAYGGVCAEEAQRVARVAQRGSVCGWVAHNGRAVVVEDVLHSPDPRTDVIRSLGIQAYCAHPLMAEGRVMGTLSFGTRTRTSFSADDVEIMRTIADQVATAMQRIEAKRALATVNAELVEADRRKNDFLALLSHELRNPLAPIHNGLHILDRAIPGGEHARRAQQIIKRQVNHLSCLVNDLLDVTRITRNKIQLVKERLDLNELTRSTAEDNRSLFEAAKVALHVEIATHPVYVFGDKTRLAQMIGNLLQNAAKFAHSGGYTRVQIASEAGQAVLTVTDNGIGMSRETLAQLFQPFMQAKQTLDRSRGGLGLGLALVKGLVDLHDGSISAHSEGIGTGTDFIVRLPISEPAFAVPKGTRPPVRASRRKVLIIDDSVDAADTLRDALELSAHEVEVAYSGPDGIQRARAFRPDMVLCDIGLPGMDGYDVARNFRADEQLRAVFLVALSGYALPDDVQRATEAGFERHLAKPPSLEQLERLLAVCPAAAE